MKYFVYGVLGFIALLLFIPLTGTSEIRNLPLLIALLSLEVIWISIRCFKYVRLVVKTKKALKKKDIQKIKLKFYPFASLFHGHYSLTFLHQNKTVQMILLSRKRKYQRYHFDSISKLEFYRSNRVLRCAKNGKVISNYVETNLVGKQKIKWDVNADLRIVLFDRFPLQVTESTRKENLGVKDKIGNSNTYLLDWETFFRSI